MSKRSSLGDPRAHARFDLVVRDNIALEHLLLPGAHRSKECDLIEQTLVYLDVHEHSSATTVLRENDRPLGGMDLLQDGRSVRAELGDRTDIG